MLAQFWYIDENHKLQYLEFAATTYMTDGNLAEAKRVFTQLIDTQPSPKADWFDMVISLCQQTGDSENTEYYIHQAMDYYPSNNNYPRLLANMYFERGDTEGGVAVLEKAGLSLPSE